LGYKTTTYLAALINNQVLCEEQPDWSYENSYNEGRRYYIKNYLTGEITWQFEDDITLFLMSWGDFLYDQCGIYLFLEKDNKLVLFDVEEKRELVPGEPLKRSEYIYYTRKKEAAHGTRRDDYGIIKHNLVTGRIEEINNRDVVPVMDIIRQNGIMRNAYLMLEEIGNNQLRLYNNYAVWIVQLDESMSEIIGISEREIEDDKSVTFIVSIDKGKYIGFKEMPGGGEAVSIYYVQLLGENGRIQQEYENIRVAETGPTASLSFGKGIYSLCLVSSDKQYVLFFEYIFFSPAIPRGSIKLFIK
jgi:hypothetical protein